MSWRIRLPRCRILRSRVRSSVIGWIRTLFYSFGPWRGAQDVAAMRESAEAGAAFGRLRELCDELTPGDYEVVRRVDVEGGGRA